MSKHESLDNLRVFCQHHSPKAGNYTHLKPEFFIGKLVKKAFPITDPNSKYKVEHMWVRVTSNDGDTLIGKLDNDPFFIPEEELKLGDEIKMKVAEVENVEGVQ